MHDSLMSKSPILDSMEKLESSGPATNGLSFVTTRTKDTQRKKKRIVLSGSLKTDFTDTLSDSDMRKRNLDIISKMDSSTLALEAAKTWDVGALLSILDDETRLATENLIEKTILAHLEEAKTS